jgi:hypothetical protein
MSQCTATAKSTGEQCQRDAIRGGNVCYVHGGATSQAQKKAQERLDEMADATTADIQQDIEDLQDEYDDADDPDEKLAILAELRKLWKIVLDRTGHGPTEKREHDHSTSDGFWQNSAQRGDE